MNEKISFPDLVTLLATKLNVTKKEAEAFLKEFFTISTEVISSGEELRINELGVFKPIWVEPRASVNVQTGEPVEIPGHYKVSFVPDKVLREAVNAPFSSFSVEILNDHVSTEAMMAVGDEGMAESREGDESEEEPVAADEPAAPEAMPLQEEVEDAIMPETDKPEAPEIEDLPGEKEEQPVVPESGVIPEPASDPDAETEPEPDVVSLEQDEPAETSEEQPLETEIQPAVEPVAETQAEPVADEPKAEVPALIPVETDADHTDYLQKSASRRAFWWGALSALGVIVVIGVAVGFFLRGDEKIKIGEYTLSLTNEEVFAPQLQANQVADTVVVSEPVDTTAMVDVAERDSVAEKPVAQSEKTERVEKTEKTSQSATTPTTAVEAEPVVETIRSGVFLTTLARKYFGHKTFWVYIYEENKKVIKNPNQVPIGTRVVIPEASKYHIDAKDRRSVEAAKALAVKILSQYE